MNLIGPSVLLLLLTASFYIRFLDLGEPRSVVFDEVHYGTICKLYKEEKFHIDVEPPAAKMFLCSSIPRETNLTLWTKIGREFPPEYPLRRLRLIPATCGVILCFVVYRIICALNFSTYAAAFASSLVVFDNALILQSRFFLPDAIVLLLQSLSLYCALGPSVWNTTSSAFVVGLALASHSSSVITWIILFCITGNKAWKIITNHALPMKSAVYKSCLHLIILLLVPLIMYFWIFSIHLANLPLPGPHNHKLSPAFQASFKEGQGSFAQEVTFGRSVTLRSVAKGCYLTSTVQNYPKSQQQMVSCTYQKNHNNWWLLAPDDLNKDGNGSVINASDHLTLIHVATHNNLQATSFAAPMTSYKHEVSCISPDRGYSSDKQWMVQIRSSDDGKSWKSLVRKVQLYHLVTETLLSVTDMKLSESGELEVMSDQDQTNWEYDETEWVVEEVLSSKADPVPDEKDKVLLGFWAKMLEIHHLMQSTASSSSAHRSTSSPHTWPLAQSTVAYWYNDKKNAQIHLVGNPVSWCAGIIAMIVYAGIICVWALGMQRRVLNVELNRWNKNLYAFNILAGGWLLHMIWLTASEQPLFLYHYLPALLYKHMLHACAAETICQLLGKLGIMAYSILTAGIIYAHNTLLPITLGFPLKHNADVQRLVWWNTWEVFDILH